MPEASAQTNRQADIEELRRIAGEFTEGFNTKDVDRIMQFYGETYVDVNLRTPQQTFAERRQYYSDVMARGLLVNAQPDDILFAGDLALIRGSIEVRNSKAPEAPATELRYLEVARKQPDGSWKMIWGMDGPVQEWTPDSR